MDKNQQQHQDHHIRDGLNALQPSTPVGGWEQLAQRLDNDAVGTNEQDALLRQKLDGLQPPFEAGSWAALNSRLDNQESDKIFFTKIDTHAPVPKVSGWAALAAKLELIAARRSAVYCYKFSELCLITAALILFLYTDSSGKAKPTQDTPSTPVALLEFAANEPNGSVNTGLPIIASPVVLDVATSEDEIDYAEVEWVVPPPKQGEVSPLEASLFPLEAFEVEGLTSLDFVAAIEALPQLDYRLASERPSVPKPSIGMVTVPENVPPTLYLRSFISPWDFNQIITPKQAVNDVILDRDDRVSYGNSLGLLLDVQYRKHAMQYGLIYSRRSYIPTVLKDVEDFTQGQGPIERRDTNYSRITFQTLSLPIVFQRELYKNDRWRLATSVGVALNVNAWATFRKSPTFDQDVLNWTRQSPQPRFGPRSPESTGLPVIDARDLVYPEQGLLQGGSLLSNVHLSASFGFSIERYFNEEMSFYVAPRFSRSIYYNRDSGAEPFNDRIHNSSIQFGTRILLGRQR